MKALIITWEGYQDQELVYPYYRLREETNIVDIVANDKVIHGILGTKMNVSITLSDFLEKFDQIFDEYDFLVLPGGVKALEKLRQEKRVLEFVKKWNDSGKVIASTCHGAQLLISAKIVKGREISGYYSLEDDINNAGAIYSREPVVTSGNIVSSPHYNWMGEWLKEAIDVYNRKV
jgi:protease I